MLGKTVIEKIFQNHSDEDVKAGKIVWIGLDVRTARDFGGANVVKNFRREYPGDKVEDPSKTFFTFDCVAPANTIPYANNQMICRNFAAEHGIKVYDVDAGIGSHVAMEKGFCCPGDTMVGTDSHLNIMGAIGAFGQGMGDQDIAFSFRSGKTWFEVPETIKVNIKGNLPSNTSPKDLTLFVLRKLGTKTALGKAIEYYGDAVDKLDLAGRTTLASMATEMSAIISFITPDRSILEFVERRSGRKQKPVTADKNAEYSTIIDIDISGLVPQIACPPNPANVKDVSEIKGKPIHSVFIGSCTNGRYEDFAVAASIMKGRKVAPGVMARLVPATQEVFGQMVESGLIKVFFDAGAIISHPGCGGCASGQLGMTGKGEVQLSTSNRNFTGKQGDGDTYLVSPQTAAASAVAGHIAEAEEVQR